MTFADAGRRHAGHDLRRVLLRAARALLGDAGLLLPRPRPADGGNTLDSPPLHAIARTAARGQRRLHLRGARARSRRQRFDGENYWVDVIFAPEAPAGPGRHASRADAGGRRRRPSLGRARHRRRRRRATRSRRSSARPRRRRRPSPARPPATTVTVTGLDPGDDLHVQGAGGQRQRHRSGCRRRPTRSRRGRRRRRRAPTGRHRQRPATSQAKVRWTAPQRRRQHDHGLHGHAVHRRRRAGRRRR